MSNQNPSKNPAWFYWALIVQTLAIIIAIGMLKDIMWIL